MQAIGKIYEPKPSACVPSKQTSSSLPHFRLNKVKGGMEWNKCAGKRREKEVRAFLGTSDTCEKQTIASRLLSSALQANLRMSQAPPGKRETSPPAQLCHHFPGLFRDHTRQETHIHMYNHGPSQIRAPHLCSGVHSTCHHPTWHTHLPPPPPSLPPSHPGHH